jgi:hypothetical protein
MTARSQPLLRAAYWSIPPLFAVWFHWLGMRTWFFADDFAWLNHATEVSNFRQLLHALFMPMAQGTIRVWSDRVYFIALYHLFGLNPLPFHIVAFLTQCANVLLLLAIAPRLTGSRVAGFAAALFWTVNSSQPIAMAWASAFNQPLCALFVLSAFYLLLRYLETGRRRYWVLQWIVFLLGFGANELNMVYPALAASYTFLCARKQFLRTLPLFLVSIAFAVVHRLATGVEGQAYQMHFGLTTLKTLATYWSWTLGPEVLDRMAPIPWWQVVAFTALLSAAVLGAVAVAARRRDYLPLFFMGWYLILIAPVLPFSEHHTEYYPFLPSAGLAMLGGWAVTRAWRRTFLWKAAAAGLVFLYVGFSVDACRHIARWEFERARNVRKLIKGVERAHELHPKQVILLDGVENDLFYTGMAHHPFPLVGTSKVYLAPGTEKLIQTHPGIGDPAEFAFAPGTAWHALQRDEAVVYSVKEERLRNITSIYANLMPTEWESLKPTRVDAGTSAAAYVLGPSWYGLDGDHRWMPRQATVELAGPRSPAARLHLAGFAAPQATSVSVSIDGARLPGRGVVPGASFDLEWEVPPAAATKPAVHLVIEVDHATIPPGEVRELGLAFGIIEIR